MAETNGYEIQRVLSNNVVLVRDPSTGSEMILTGKGIGFGKKSGQQLDNTDSLIEKKYVMESESHLQQLQTLTNQIDQDVISISEDIISMIANQITADINEHIHIALPSHIQFAVYRLKHNVDIANPFLYEIQSLYPREYELAEQAAYLISSHFHVQVPESEVGFLAMHIHSAVYHVSVSEMVQFNNLIRIMVEYIEKVKQIRIKRDTLDYIRLITHLRFAVERIRQGKSSYNPFLQNLKTGMSEEYEIACKLCEIMQEKLQVEIPEDEIGYITMHLFRLFQQVDSKQ